MPMPELTDDVLTGLSTSGRRVLASADILRTLYERTLWLARVKPQIHWSWGDGLGCATLGAASPSFSVSPPDTTVRNEWNLGTARVPGVGNNDGVVRLYVAQTEYSSGTLRAGLKIRAPSDAGWTDLGTFSLGTSNAWVSGTFTVPAGMADAPFEVQVYVTTWNGSASSAAQASILAWSLCSEGTAWSRAKTAAGAHFRRTTNPPDDVFTLRLLRDLQDETAELPRVLANHSFREQNGSGSNEVAYYVVPAPYDSDPITVYALVSTSTGTAELKAKCGTDAGSALVASSETASQSFTDTTPTWISVQVTPTGGSTNYLTVWADPDGGHTVELYAVYAVQEENADSDFVTGAPGWRVLPVSERDVEPGAAIVNAWSGAFGGEALDDVETIQNLWTDRFASLSNAIWWLRTRSHSVVPGDWCRPTETYTGAFSATSLAQSIQTLVAPAFGSKRVRLAVRPTTDGVMLEDGERILTRVNIGAYQAQSFGATVGGFLSLGSVPVDGVTLDDMVVRSGYLNGTGAGGEPASGTVPFRLAGAVLWEDVALDAPNLCHIRTFSDTGITIPDNDTVTGASDSVVVTRSFPIGMLRVIVNLSHPVPGQVKLTISDGTTTRELAGFGNLSADGVLSFSDAWEDDLAPTESLDAFRREDSAATWTLTAYDNAAGDEGEVLSWSLEIW